jgi:4-alpha-glucanotransferase
LRHCAYLRIDHVMGLQRLYWIPRGFDAQHGAYVSYRADELHAVVSLEAARAGVVIVGEDLGTVPDSVRSRMAEDRMLRSWVMQFESSPARPLPTPPALSVASWGTHDLPRFGSYFRGEDIDEKELNGQLSLSEAAFVRVERARWRDALLAHMDASSATVDLASVALRLCLAHVSESTAKLVLVDLEELWGERQPQNRPGTAGGANWRRRTALTLQEIREDAGIASFLSALNRMRHHVSSASNRSDGL